MPRRFKQLPGDSMRFILKVSVSLALFALPTVSFAQSRDASRRIYKQLAELTASDETSISEFGTAVAIDRNTAVVGAPAYGNSLPGAAYVFVEPPAGWSN